MEYLHAVRKNVVSLRQSVTQGTGLSGGSPPGRSKLKGGVGGGRGGGGGGGGSLPADNSTSATPVTPFPHDDSEERDFQSPPSLSQGMPTGIYVEAHRVRKEGTDARDEYLADV